jgi:hypothetical protein
MKNIVVFVLIGLTACVSAQENQTKNVVVEPVYIEAKSFNNIPT